MSPSTKTQSAHLDQSTLLKPAINAWKIYLEDQGKSPHTVKAFVADLRLLASFLPPDQEIGAVTTQELNNFLEWLQRGRGVPCSPKTLARRITSIKAFFRWLQKGGVLLVDPAERVVQKSVLSPVPEVLNPQEVDLALEAARRRSLGPLRDTRHLALFTLLLHTGLKKSECLNLAIGHIDLEDPDGPTLFVRYASPANRYKERKISVPESWIPIYQDYLGQYHPADTIFPWSQRRLEYLLEDISNDAGLKKHISFAMCRWTCALIDLRSDQDGNSVRQKLGVSKVQWRELKMKLDQLDRTTPRAEKKVVQKTR